MRIIQRKYLADDDKQKMIDLVQERQAENLHVLDLPFRLSSEALDEPLGCHADFRKYALGRVALCETLRRLQQHNVKNIFVETDKYRNTAFRLYESVGFQVAREVAVYGKDYNDDDG